MLEVGGGENIVVEIINVSNDGITDGVLITSIVVVVKLWFLRSFVVPFDTHLHWKLLILRIYMKIQMINFKNKLIFKIISILFEKRSEINFKTEKY